MRRTKEEWLALYSAADASGLSARQWYRDKQTISNWIVRCGERYGKLLYKRMLQHLRKESYLHGDEISLQVLREPERKASTKSFMWLFTTGWEADKKIHLFYYAPSRSEEVPKCLFPEYEGYIQCDGLDSYNQREKAERVGCMAHVRRKFFEAHKVEKEKIEKGVITPAAEGCVDATGSSRWIRRPKRFPKRSGKNGRRSISEQNPYLYIRTILDRMRSSKEELTEEELEALLPWNIILPEEGEQEKESDTEE